MTLFTGELIGVEYLFSQTGQVLEPVNLDPEIPQQDDDAEMEEADEGFVEPEETPGETLPPLDMESMESLQLIPVDTKKADEVLQELMAATASTDHGPGRAVEEAVPLEPAVEAEGSTTEMETEADDTQPDAVKTDEVRPG